MKTKAEIDDELSGNFKVFKIKKLFLKLLSSNMSLFLNSYFGAYSMNLKMSSN